jgi:hypothetical protein
MILTEPFVVAIALLFAQFTMGMMNIIFIVVPLNAHFNFLGYSGG